MCLHQTFRNRSFLHTLITVAALLAHGSVQAIGSADPDFNAGQIRFETFEDEYGLGYVPDIVSPRGLFRGNGSSTYMAAFAVVDYDMTGSFRLGLARYHLDGSLDSSFGTGAGVAGLIMRGWPGNADRFIVTAADQDSESRLLVAGSVKNDGNPALVDSVVCRMTNAGTFDTQYGSNGCRRLPALSNTDIVMNPLIRADASGGVYVAVSTGSIDRIQRLDNTGAIDVGFGIGGVLTVQPPASSETSISDMAMLPDGGLIVIGSSTPPDDGMGNDNYNWFALRVLSDGSEDQTFGSLNGYRQIAFDLSGDPAARYDWAASVVVNEEGDLLIVGNVQVSANGYGVAMIKLAADGIAIDPDYGTGTDSWFGFTQVSTSNLARKAALLPDGSLLVAGQHELNFNPDDLDPAMLVLDADGELDTRFWQFGSQVVAIDRAADPGNNGRDWIHSITVDAGMERVLLLGRAEGFENDDWQGMLMSLALHDRLFKDGLEDQ